MTAAGHKGTRNMTGTVDGRDPVELAVALASRLSGQTLPDATAAMLRGERPMLPADGERIASVFRQTLDAPALTSDQRVGLRSLIQTATAGHPDVANAVHRPDAHADVHDPLSAPTASTTTPTPAPPPPPTRTSTGTPWDAEATDSGGRRRWPRVVLAVAVLGALAGTSWLAWTNYRAGEEWRRQAAAAKADVARLTDANETLESDLEELGESLRRSEADVSLLEERVSRAADEKARAEDEREMANAYAERVTEIAVAYDEVAQWFSACRAEQSVVTTMVFDFEDYYLAGQTYLISTQIDQAAETCSTAENYLAGLRSYVQALGQ